MNPFKNLNRAQKRKFNRMSKEDKAKIIEAAVQQEISPHLASKLCDGMITGMDLQNHHLYKKYVSKIDSGSLSGEERHTCMEQLLSAIRLGHIEHVKRFGDTEVWEDKQ